MRISSGRIAIAALGLMAVAYGVAEFRGPNGYSGLLEKRQQVHEMEVENRSLRADIDRLDKRVDKLRHDQSAQELEVRKRLKFIAPNEQVYILQSDHKAKTASK